MYNKDNVNFYRGISYSEDNRSNDYTSFHKTYILTGILLWIVTNTINKNDEDVCVNNNKLATSFFQFQILVPVRTSTVLVVVLFLFFILFSCTWSINLCMYILVCTLHWTQDCPNKVEYSTIHTYINNVPSVQEGKRKKYKGILIFVFLDMYKI